MIFNTVMGLEKTNLEKIKIISREAVRAIIYRNNNILMIHTNKGDYKFPGGGVNKKENHEDTLKREVREESGYIIDFVKEKQGTVIERRLDEYEENSIFEMTSHYYLCEISGVKTVQQLDDYESELNFQPVWITIDKAIQFNEEIINSNDKNKNVWVYRETLVLKALKEFNNI